MSDDDLVNAIRALAGGLASGPTGLEFLAMQWKVSLEAVATAIDGLAEAIREGQDQ